MNKSLLRLIASLMAVAALSACAGTPVADPGAAGSASGVTVYGTADVGMGRVRR